MLTLQAQSALCIAQGMRENERKREREKERKREKGERKRESKIACDSHAPWVLGHDDVITSPVDLAVLIEIKRSGPPLWEATLTYSPYPGGNSDNEALGSPAAMPALYRGVLTVLYTPKVDECFLLVLTALCTPKVCECLRVSKCVGRQSVRVCVERERERERESE
jgi:hypothetical protein